MKSGTASSFMRFPPYYFLGLLPVSAYALVGRFLSPILQSLGAPFPQIDIIGAVVIVWRVRGKTIRFVLCNIVCNNCEQCDAHTYEQTNSSLDWVLSHCAHFTVLGFILVLCITVCCMHA